MDSEGIYGQETFTQMIKNFIKSHSVNSHARVGDNLRSLYRIAKQPRLNFRLAKYAHTASLENEAASLRVPTVILWGDQDYLTPPWQGEKLHQLIKDSRLILLKGMDHDWPLHSPELFWQNI